MKTITPLMTTGIILVLGLGLTGCSSSNAPGDLEFDLADGTFSFSAVEGADTYTVGVSKQLNDATGAALAGINGSTQITNTAGDEVYVWSEQTGSATSLADTDDDGVVDGQVIFREFSSTAVSVGDVLSMDQLPVGHYVLSAAPAANDVVTAPETSLYEFVVPGQLEAPEGFSAEVDASGAATVQVGTDYLLSALTVTGLPERIVIEIFDGEEVVETLELEDFSYTNTVQGPNKTFNFTNATLTGTAELEPGVDYTGTVTAVGDGDEILDATADLTFGTDTPALEIAAPLEVSGTTSVGAADIEVVLDSDVYELTWSLNGIVVARESGTVVVDAASAAFASGQSDRDPVLDGVTLAIQDGTLVGDALPADGSPVAFAAPQFMGPR